MNSNLAIKTISLRKLFIPRGKCLQWLRDTVMSEFALDTVTQMVLSQME